ncbi:glycosyltransferase [Phytohabitans sp. ZYX-F-186]|uniref:Glycosyltransferase n=1 Tax=Phytohabitans maris TaxID=3071409 RepID=A0ABU0ZME0_9ACTN|nr:glycosyltransferase [Phytohabitans sp. ZYX-F-186]MDQ7908208.1 glycosyltransferase [Phytohabitans sp. ZYX-F-186]
MPYNPFKVLMTCGVFEPGFRGGGMVRAVVQTVDTVSDRVDLLMVTRDRDLGARAAYPGLSGRWVARRGARVFYLPIASPRQWLRLWSRLRRTQFDLLYANSLWEPRFSVLPIVAARLGLIRARKVLLSPHGELSPGALALKNRKKRLFLALWGPLLRGMRVTWHAVSDREADEIRAVCPWADVVVNPYQVPLPREPLPPRRADAGPVSLVFIGRISPKKNLDLVLDALARVSARVRFDIYGPCEDADYWARCQVLIRRLPGNVAVAYRGEVAPDAVRETFARYDAFVFPTLGENFGYVIAESLSASCPVLCSGETPWNPVLAGGGGLVLDTPTAADLAKELERLAGTSPEERFAARQRAGETYRLWRDELSNENLLDRVREATWTVPGGTNPA